MEGSPRIVGELAKLGIDVAKSTVERYRVRPTAPPSPTWRVFLDNHVKDLVSIDFFTFPTVRFQVLFVFLVLAHHRRRVVHFNVSANPTSQWTAHQVVEAFPWDSAPRYLLRDRDSVYGSRFRARVHSLTIRRECVDHVIILNERHLKRVLAGYFHSYHQWRIHRSLDMDSPDPRSDQLPELGQVVECPDVGGLHHHYERRAA